MATIRFEGVQKTYPNGHVAARGLDLSVADGEFVVLVGPSGCGKSTALRMLAGLETPTGGRIFIGDHDVTAVAPQDRDVAMVFQSYALYPHMKVRDNMGFGLRMRGAAPERIAARVAEVAQALGLEQVLDRKPGQLSGGQRQRVALGRAIAREPQVFLLDEPLSNLDTKLRVETRAELARLHRRLRATIVYVTHDQEEAMTLGDRVVVMHDGAIEQAAPPMEVYSRPATLFVAGFVGSPEMNLLPQPDGTLLGVRPQDLAVVSPGTGELEGMVDVVEPRGSELLLYVRAGGALTGRDLRVIAPPDLAVSPEQPVGLRLDPARVHRFDPSTGRRLD
jgi:multiple sugar transport system ATP-binding protein